MKRERTKNVDLGSQAKRHATMKPTRRKEYEGDTENVLSTGSTLLDLAISGGCVRGGGIPAGIMVVAYGDHRDLHSFPTRRSSDLINHLQKCLI